MPGRAPHTSTAPATPSPEVQLGRWGSLLGSLLGPEKVGRMTPLRPGVTRHPPGQPQVSGGAPGTVTSGHRRGVCVSGADGAGGRRG